MVCTQCEVKPHCVTWDLRPSRGSMNSRRVDIGTLVLSVTAEGIFRKCSIGVNRESVISIMLVLYLGIEIGAPETGFLLYLNATQD